MAGGGIIAARQDVIAKLQNKNFILEVLLLVCGLPI
jgi:hypothetical protein